MPRYKCVVQYVQFNSDWKEVFYAAADNPDQIAGRFDAGFVAATKGLRHPSVYVDSVRINDLANSRSTLTVQIQSGTTPVTTATPDVTRTTCVYTLRADNPPLLRKIWLRGLNDADVVRSATTGKDERSPALATNVGTYLAALEARQFQVQSLMPITGTPPYTRQRVASVTVGPSGITTINMVLPVQLTTGGRVILSLFDAKSWPGLNGKYSAESPAGSSFGVSYIARQAPGTYAVSRGTMRVEEYRYAIISAGKSTFLRFSSRDTRSSPFGGRGRKKAARLRFA